MPSPVKFNRDVILEEAFRIVRSHGLSGLSARGVARELGCSTQPIYSAFGSMAKLRTAIEKRAYDVFLEYLLEEPSDCDPFLSMGLQYFRFARQEKVLFRTFFLEGEMALTVEKIREISAPLLDRMKQDPSLNQLSDDQLDRIGGDMWVYTHGLAGLTFRSESSEIESYFRNKISLMGETVIEWEYRQADRQREPDHGGDNG